MAGWIDEKKNIPASLFLETANKLNILRGDLDDRFYTLEHNLAVEKASMFSDPEMTSAKAESMIKARPEYMEMRKLSAKIKQLEEFVRVAKKMATLKDTEFNQQ